MARLGRGKPQRQILTRHAVLGEGETASGSPSITKPTSAGTLVVTNNASGTPSLTKPTSTGTGTVTGANLASGSPSLTKPTSAGTGLHPLPVVTDVDTDEAWVDGDTGLVITGTGFV